MVFIDIEKGQYTDILKTLPKRLSEISIPVFHNAITLWPR